MGEMASITRRFVVFVLLVQNKPIRCLRLFFFAMHFAIENKNIARYSMFRIVVLGVYKLRTAVSFRKKRG